MSNDQRIDELTALAQAEGLTLPFPPAVIVAIEDQGGMVHLESGQILWNGADVPMGLTPTAAAEALVTDGLIPTEIVEGLVLWLFPCENVEQIRADYLNLQEELRRQPGLGDEPYVPFQLDPEFYADVLPDEWRSDYIGD